MEENEACDLICCMGSDGEVVPEELAGKAGVTGESNCTLEDEVDERPSRTDMLDKDVFRRDGLRVSPIIDVRRAV